MRRRCCTCERRRPAPAKCGRLASTCHLFMASRLLQICSRNAAALPCASFSTIQPAPASCRHPTAVACHPFHQALVLAPRCVEGQRRLNPQRRRALGVPRATRCNGAAPRLRFRGGAPGLCPPNTRKERGKRSYCVAARWPSCLKRCRCNARLRRVHCCVPAAARTAQYPWCSGSTSQPRRPPRTPHRRTSTAPSTSRHLGASATAGRRWTSPWRCPALCAAARCVAIVGASQVRPLAPLRPSVGGCHGRCMQGYIYALCRSCILVSPVTCCPHPPPAVTNLSGGAQPGSVGGRQAHHNAAPWCSAGVWGRPTRKAVGVCPYSSASSG